MSRFTIRPARPDEGPTILEVMRPWNMHHVPSAEMESLDLNCFFVAEMDGVIIGASGYRILGPGQGKTTLLAVLPEHLGTGAGAALQLKRMEAMAALGVHTITTNADRPETIAWYKSRFGYTEVGKLAKIHDFGRSDIDHWTTLQCDLAAYLREAQSAAKAS
jgi:ribosomal-protein-alanine N-acetyltransferase